MQHNRTTKILLVDDNPANLITLEAVLASQNYELIQAPSGHAAIKLCSEQDFALVVLDVNMPMLDGYQTARIIKAQEKNRDVPIIFITATYHEDHYVKKGYEVGAVDFFGKPFDPEILKTKVSIYSDLYLKTKRFYETEELLKSHEQIKKLLEVIPIGIVITDVTGKIYESNQEAKRILGVKGRVEIPSFNPGRSWRDDGQLIQPHQRAMTRALMDGVTTRNQRIEIETMDGHRKTIQNSAFPIRRKDGAIQGAVSILQEITPSQHLVDAGELVNL